MKRHVKSSLLPLLLCLVLLLSCVGCSRGFAEPEEDPNVTSAPAGVDNPLADLTLAEVKETDREFTLNYSVDYTFNPITGTNVYNMAVASFVYEGLFALDGDLSVRNVLCESYATTDGITYTIKLVPDVLFHDGSPLTADDVSYSLTLAGSTEKYTSRLSDIEEINVTDERTLEIVLDSPNFMLPALLDIPIIESGAIEENRPAGTGPYRFSGTSELVAFEDYRNPTCHPLNTISLTMVKAENLTDRFSSHEIDLLPTDLSGINSLSLSIDYDTSYYNTTTLQYIGFNMDNGVLQDARFRRAVSSAIDRDVLSSSVMEGWATPAPLILNSCLACYNPAWEADAGYSPDRLSKLLREIGMKDTDEDGFLEYPTSDGPMPVTLRLLVNEENRFKVAAADEIVSALRSAGIDISLETLPWDDYLDALEKGEFDLYYAETRFYPDFDFSELFAGESTLNFGLFYDDHYQSLIDDFLGASADGTRAAAAAALCDYVNENCHIVPVVYKQAAVLTHWGIVSGIAPSLSTATGNLSNWTVTFEP